MAFQTNRLPALATQTFLPTSAIRQIDSLAIEHWGIPGIVLMENAALGCVAELRRIFPTQCRVTILCGTGNNAGDGFAIARHLEIADYDVTLLVLDSIDQRLKGDAKTNFDIARKSGARFISSERSTAPTEISAEITEAIGMADIIVDAMLGTGATGNPRPPMNTWIEAANQSPGYRLAVDIPSGLDSETGQLGTPTFKADMTCTFVAQKVGFQSKTAKSVLGEVKVIGIGIPRQLWLDSLHANQPPA